MLVACGRSYFCCNALRVNVGRVIEYLVRFQLKLHISIRETDKIDHWVCCKDANMVARVPAAKGRGYWMIGRRQLNACISTTALGAE